MSDSSEDKNNLIRNIYWYLASFVALILLISGSINLLILGLNNFIFKEADRIISYQVSKPIGSEISEEEWREQQKAQIEADKQQRISQKHKKASSSIAMIIVGFVVFVLRKKIL